MAKNLSNSEAILRYSAALLVSIATLSLDLAPEWIALASFSICYLAFTAMMQCDPLYAVISELARKATAKTPIPSGVNAPATL
ncbi:MAG: hypothetical protein FD165_440 [Gammaproteobacteria bacterium]|nr:MAG: hypothetical protein FD165_440 [Gammaproteobacteria bacterium]TND02297.1 MAG: hypothetical protein FD120_2461 [Gammaproteobacteria bacterium]